MASISKRTVNGKPRYDVNYREPDGRQRRKTFTKKIDADNFVVSVESDKLRGTYIDRDAGRITFKKYAESWLASAAFEYTTREAVESRLKNHIYPQLGGKTLVQIKPSTIQAWLSSLKHLSPTTQRLMFAHVSAILSAAVDDERLPKNPCKAGSVRTPRAQTRKVVPWTVEEVGKIIAALPERYRVTAVLGAGLGLRQGEVFGLSPDDVDWLRGTVEVQRQVKVLSGNKLIFGLPKGNKVRSVPLPDAVRDLLAAYLVAYPAQRVELPWREPDGEPVAVSLLVTSRQGGPLNKNYFNSAIWRKALDRAGLASGGTGNGMHGLRHHYASVLLDGGENIKALSEYLGHADAGFTLRTYTHLMPSSHERTRKAVEAAFRCYIGGTSTPENTAQEA